MKSKALPLNYKTKICTSWENYSICNYGRRCFFKHPGNVYVDDYIDDLKETLWEGFKLVQDEQQIFNMKEVYFYFIREIKNNTEIINDFSDWLKGSIKYLESTYINNLDFDYSIGL